MDNTPLCFTQLLGHEKAKKILTRGLASGRISHGYIFRGPDGVGKKLFARGMAAAINCRDTKKIGACGICVSCKKFRSSNHPDFMVVSPEKGVIKINQIRQLCREINYPPYESAMRVVVLEDVHTMRREAANSLLKTLEEPPEDNVLILTAESSQEILPTLISRCQQINFSPLSDSVTQIILKTHGIEQGSASLLARLSEGSPGKALVIEKKEIVQILKRLVSLLSDPAIDPDLDVGKLLQLAAEMVALKDNLADLFGLLRLWLRDLLMADQGGAHVSENSVISLLGGDRPLKSWNSDVLFAKLRAIDRAEEELARNCNKTLVCEVLLFKLQ